MPQTVARAVLFRDATIAPLGAPTVEVFTTAKRDLPAGTVLDGLGGYDYYGQAERADVTARAAAAVGVAEGCRLLRSVPKDEVIGYDDVELPAGRLVDELPHRPGTALAGISTGWLRSATDLASARREPPLPGRRRVHDKPWSRPGLRVASSDSQELWTACLYASTMRTEQRGPRCPCRRRIRSGY